ncbi:MAG: hypothetical protein KME64_22645 [Scytonematopsis contorta HA4267-MV1]|jgi:hypothetical protein|nr:hypothetical protein [Scytonematopsis contorta HA4267-MV1]
MQLIENGIDEQLLSVLEDIVQKVEIHSDFSIRHPDYKPLEISKEVTERFLKSPLEMQYKYLSLQLRNFIYGIYYNGSLKSSLALDNKENALPQDWENNTLLGVDLEFYERLHENNHGLGYFDPAWSVVREEIDGSLAVSKNGLRLHIHRDKHLQLSDMSAKLGDSVAVLMPKNIVQNGFYMAVSNVLSQGHGNIVRVYFNFTADAAVEVMGGLTKLLNAIPIFFRFKVLYNPDEYKRCDSGVLYFEKFYYKSVHKVLEAVYLENKSCFGSEVPLFTMQLAPGLALAEEPDNKFADQESFGMNRCQIVANGLLEGWLRGDCSAEGRLKAILRQFSRLGIDLQGVYLNSGSEGVYKPIM